MRGKTVLVTGGTGGIGKETARGLARLGAEVILVGRDGDRADAAVAELRRDTGNPRIEALLADVTSQDDLRRLAAQVRDRGAVDVLINNAGVVKERRELTADGVETAFAANVVAPYLLTRLLMPVLRGRVINIAGGVPRGRIALENLQGEKSYVGLSHYNQTKLALMAMSRAFAEQVREPGITINVGYPGHASTDMNKALPTSAYPPVARPIVPLLRRLMPVLYGGAAIGRAASSSVHLASDPGVAEVHGAYFNSKAQRAPWPAAVEDRRNREAIWALCAELTG
ncbi:SDR family NAD(P)-dependent oxidoreductase [Saccharopolyspora indica]|uniref:SDR family NAD(P)-dependent oxidoreductase n=1 Tax=Saccharopolyspora indica TaxID=1229659 RepID=UPI0022EB3580|nr:SDR family NAD(P)-dependent oxidoreductase [Saccharopolyspora indica]MDA3647344.1 SDR family NAD(P)-dependent oxidoreductase [Saccharopolyspora indica]